MNWPTIDCGNFPTWFLIIYLPISCFPAANGQLPVNYLFTFFYHFTRNHRGWKSTRSCSLEPVHVWRLPEWARNWRGNVNGEEISSFVSWTAIRKHSESIQLFPTRNSQLTARSRFSVCTRLLQVNTDTTQRSKRSRVDECEVVVIGRITFGINCTSISKADSKANVNIFAPKEIDRANEKSFQCEREKQGEGK